MILTTSLPIEVLFFKHWNTDDTEVGVIVAKARFVPTDAGGWEPDPSPPPLVVSDVFEGDPATGYLLQEQEIAPAKAATDILLQAIARSPSGTPMSDWPVFVTIPDRLSYGFHVRGPCQWQRSLGRWRVSAPDPVTEVPLTYDLAYGGASPGDTPETPDIYEFNPSGVGYANPARLAAKEPFPAPQVGELAEFMAADVKAEMTLHGVGPLAKAWLPRRSNAGTFDEEWQRIRHPRMPHDYSMRFWNCAPSALQLTPFLTGNETIILEGLSHGPDPISITLPGAGLNVSLSGAEQADLQLTLDTVTLDVRETDANKHSIDMIWRGLVRDPADYDKGNITSLRVG